MVLNAVWLLVTQQGWIWISVVVILALAIVLGLIMRQLTQYAAGGRMEQLVVDGTFGLYLGWVTVATCANVTAAAEVSGAELAGPAAEFAALGVLALAAALGIVLAIVLRGRWAIAVAAAWGLSWIAVGRLTDEPRSILVAIGAVVAALVVLLATAWRRARD